MAPFDALYGSLCRSPMRWLEGGQQLVVGLEILQDSQRVIETICQ